MSCANARAIDDSIARLNEGHSPMLTLSNAMLEVEMLDPRTDRDRFGTRYCTGGYIFQVNDRALGALLSGPTFPDSFNWFDGQGIPDAFNLGPLNSAQTPGDALIIGIGICDLKHKVVRSYCDWAIAPTSERVVFTTRQRYENFEFGLVRTVLLAGRTVRSHTTLDNTGKAPVPIRWFPHPFYPQPQSDELLWVNAPLRWTDAPGYTRLSNGFIARAGWPWTNGHYLALDHDATAPLVLAQRHPSLGIVTAACSYVPDFFPIWGNPITFSWEPFFERTVAPGQHVSWSIDYVF
jgi:hypothetical protein